MLNRYVVRSRITEAQFRRLARCVAADLTAVQIAMLTGLNRNTVNRLLAGLRQRMAEACELDSPFNGTVEVDESYFGPRRVKGKAGRGAGKKTPVFGILKRAGKVYTEIVPDCSKAVLQRAIRGKVSRRSVYPLRRLAGLRRPGGPGVQKALACRSRQERVLEQDTPRQPHQRHRGLLGLRQDPPGPLPRHAPSHVLLPLERV